jgi:dipeptidyl aminopeptidase/acylaminoacyl peptidase
MRYRTQLVGLAGATLLFGSALAASAQTAQTWPYPDDVPKPKPVSVELGGESEPDITRLLLAQGVGGAKLSPDASQLLFVSTITGKPQLWVVDTAGGAPRQLTFGLGVDGGQWSPDGRLIIYNADRGGDERYGFYAITPDGQHETELVAKSSAFTTFGDFVGAGQSFAYATTQRDGSAFDTWVAPLAGGAPHELFRGRMGLYPALANPQGTSIAMIEARGESGLDLSVLDVATGHERILRKPAEPAMNNPVAWTPDGRHLYFVTNEDREFTALAELDVATGKSRIVEAPPYSIVAAALSADGRYLAWQTDEHGFDTIHLRDLETGRMLATPELPAGSKAIGFARSAPVLAITIEGPNTPGEVWTWDCRTGRARQAVAPNSAGVDLSALAVPHVVEFKARDGVPLSGLLYMPAKGRKPAPVFLRLHGGPSSHALADWKPDMQYLVASGVAVLDFNYRGSSGAGKALAHLNDGRLRPNEIGDLLDAVAWIKRQPGLDGAHVAVGGSSYGGYLTNAVVGKHPGVFVAAVSQAGVADWTRNLRDASPELKASDRLEYGNIDDPAEQAFFTSISPMTDAAKVRTPMIVETGANDPRDGAAELDAYVAAIRKGGGQVTYMRYENEGHSLRDTADIVDFNRAKVAFLKDHLGLSGQRRGPAAATPAK